MTREQSKTIAVGTKLVHHAYNMETVEVVERYYRAAELRYRIKRSRRTVSVKPETIRAEYTLAKVE